MRDEGTLRCVGWWLVGMVVLVLVSVFVLMMMGCAVHKPPSPKLPDTSRKVKREIPIEVYARDEMVVEFREKGVVVP